MIHGAAISYSGIALLIVGVILANLAVSKMAKILRLHWEIGSNAAANDRRSRNIIQRYRAANPSGHLYRNLQIAYWICGISGVLVIAGVVISQRR